MNHIPTRTSRYAIASLGVLIAAAAAAQPQERPASVQVSRAQVRQLAPSVHATGLVQSRAAADLAAGVGGRLQWVAEPGTSVSAGDLVARMDVRELSLARAEQAARVKRAGVNLTSLDRELERLRAEGAVPRRGSDPGRRAEQ